MIVDPTDGLSIAAMQSELIRRGFQIPGALQPRGFYAAKLRQVMGEDGGGVGLGDGVAPAVLATNPALPPRAEARPAAEPPPVGPAAAPPARSVQPEAMEDVIEREVRRRVAAMQPASSVPSPTPAPSPALMPEVAPAVAAAGTPRAMEILALIDGASRRMAAAGMFAGIGPGMIVEACERVAPLFGVQDGDWLPMAVIPMLLVQMSEALERAGLSAAEALAVHAESFSHPVARLVSAAAALQQRQSVSAGAATAGATAREGSGSSAQVSVLRGTLDRMAADPDVVGRMQQIVATSGKEGADGTLRSQVRDLERLSADAAFVLHQEGLDSIATTGTPAPHPATQRLWDAFYLVRPRLLAARLRYYGEGTRKQLPRGVSAEAMLKAVNAGKPTVAVLAGTTSKVAKEQQKGLLKVWAVFAAMVEDMFPRDKTARRTLCEMAFHTFDVGWDAPADAIQAGVADVFTAMARRSARFLSGAGDAPEWSATRHEAVSSATYEVILTAGASRRPQQTPAERAAAERAATAAKEKAAAEAAEKAATGASAPADSPKKK